MLGWRIYGIVSRFRSRAENWLAGGLSYRWRYLLLAKPPVHTDSSGPERIRCKGCSKLTGPTNRLHRTPRFRRFSARGITGAGSENLYGTFARQAGNNMETQPRFLGVCILIAAAIVAAALVYHAQSGRYQFQQSSPPNLTRILDTMTGKVTQL